MTRKITAAAMVMALIIVPALALSGSESKDGNADKEDAKIAEPDKLLIVWTSGDPEVALNMVFMYAHNAKKKGWWKEVRLVIWGPSAELAVKNADIKSKLMEMDKDGVELMACKACADRYEASKELESMGVEVLYIGQDFTAMLKGPWKVLTF